MSEPKITQKEQDELFCQSMIAVGRRLRKISGSGITEPMVALQADGYRGEISHILIEHLNPEQMVELATAFITNQIGESLAKILLITRMSGREFDADIFCEFIGRFCTEKLGREVKV